MIRRAPNVMFFDSPADAARYHLEHNCYRDIDDLSWYGNETADDSRRYATTGKSDGIADALSLKARLAVTAVTEQYQDEPDIMGCYPVVPEAIAGIPDCMRMPTAVESSRAPVRIFASLTTSSGVTAAQLMQRGVALLALAAAVAAQRPCDLYVFNESALDNGKTIDGHSVHFIAVRVPVQNGVLSQTAYPLTSAGFARRICYDIRTKDGGSPHWPVLRQKNGRTLSGVDDMRAPEYIAIAREIMGLNERDIYVPGLHLYDDLMTKPEQWIARELARINSAD